MRSVWFTPAALVIAALIVIGVLYAWGNESVRQAVPSTGSNTYTNPTYGYSVVYPSGYTSTELEPEFAEIGQQQNGTLSQVADIATLHASVQDPVPSFAAFVNLSAQLACNVSGPSVVTCGQVATSSTFTSASGIVGTELYFTSNAGQRGPFYAFDITRNVPNASYAVLLIYPPSQLAAHDADKALLREIASSVQITFK